MRTNEVDDVLSIEYNGKVFYISTTEDISKQVDAMVYAGLLSEDEGCELYCKAIDKMATWEVRNLSNREIGLYYNGEEIATRILSEKTVLPLSAYGESVLCSEVSSVPEEDREEVKAFWFESLKANGVFVDSRLELTDEQEQQVMGVLRGEDTSSQDEDLVNSPKHYTEGGIETIDFIEAKQLGFHLANVIKYTVRAGKKDKDKTLEDLKKAQWYLARYINSLDPS